jgi:hypothetical protein
MDRSYLTLQKFSTNSDGVKVTNNKNRNADAELSNVSFNGSRATTSRPDQTTNSLMNKNVFSINDDTLANNDIGDDENDLLNQSKSVHSSRNTSRTNLKSSNNNLFDAYENQIIKNIQSIRRNSNSSGSGGSNSKLNNNNSRRGSSGASSNRSTSKKQAAAAGVTTMPSSSSSQPNLNKAQTNDNDDDDDDDDDDDIFSGSSQLVKPMTAVNINTKSASLTNLKSNNSLEKQANLDYTDDISFNDDYGDEAEDEERMLKTKNTLKSNQRGKEAAKKGVVTNTQAPPKPVPRKKYAEKEDEDDDGSDQNLDDYGDEEEEDDDKF